MSKNSKIASHNGPRCRRCGISTTIYEHVEITPKLMRQPFYYSRWFKCPNPKCKATMIMPDEYRVFPVLDYGLDV